MKKLNTFLHESFRGSVEVKNGKFRRLMKQAGLEKVMLMKGDGYFYIDSDDEETYDIINSIYDTSIYMNSFNQQSPEEWVNDIKRLMEQK